MHVIVYLCMLCTCHCYVWLCTHTLHLKNVPRVSSLCMWERLHSSPICVSFFLFLIFFKQVFITLFSLFCFLSICSVLFSFVRFCVFCVFLWWLCCHTPPSFIFPSLNTHQQHASSSSQVLGRLPFPTIKEGLCVCV